MDLLAGFVFWLSYYTLSSDARLLAEGERMSNNRNL